MRKSKPKKRILLPDPKFNDQLVTRFVNMLMYQGKKNTSYAIFYDALAKVEEKTKEPGLDAWKKATAAEKVEFLADGNGEFAKAIDLTFDGSGNGLGTRSKRYAMLVEDGVVKKLNIEEAPGKVEVSGGDALLKQL